jgi:hypothetical protein
MKKFCFAVVCTFFASGPAWAGPDLVEVIYTGVVASGGYCDTTCERLGLASVDFTGKTYVARYFFDLANSVQWRSSDFNWNAGGPDNGSPSPEVATYFSVDGFTFSIGANENASIKGGLAAWNATQQDHSANFGYWGGPVEYSATVWNHANGESLSSSIWPVQYHDLAAEGDYVFGTAGYSAVNQTTGQYLYSMYAILTPQTLTYADYSGPVPAAPEPSTWSLLLAGFASIGFAARRRKGQAASGLEAAPTKA